MDYDSLTLARICSCNFDGNSNDRFAKKIIESATWICILFLVFDICNIAFDFYLFVWFGGEGGSFGNDDYNNGWRWICFGKCDYRSILFRKSIEYFNEHLPLIVTLWLMGMVFFLFRLLGGLIFIQELKIQQHQPLSSKWQTTFQKIHAVLTLNHLKIS